MGLGKIILAEFEGYNIECDGEYATLPDMLEVLYVDEFKYDTDWESLLPILNKIKNTIEGLRNKSFIKIDTNQQTVELLVFINGEQISFQTKGVNEAYEMCVEFIPRLENLSTVNKQIL